MRFETAVFEGDELKQRARYETWEEAEAGHAHLTAYIAACGRLPGEERAEES